MRFWSLLVVFVAAGCAGGPPPPPPTGLAADLPGTSWTVERVVEADGDLGRGQAQAIAFGTEGDLRITACNDCTGRYAIADDVLTVEPYLACTKRACPGSAIPFETVLGIPTAIRRDGAYLVIENDSLNVQLLLVPAGGGTRE